MNCPHCEKRFEVPSQVFMNVENYGDGSFHIACKRCGGAVWVRGIRRVSVLVVGMGNKEKVEAW